MANSRRTIARASTLVLAAATLAACSDSTAPLDLDSDQLVSIGESIAFEIEGAVFQLTAGDAMGTVETPVFSLRSSSPRMLARDGAFRLRSSAAVAECGVMSQNPPTDSDADGVPDNLSISFALPACHYEDVDGNIDITGVMRLSDPLPGNAGMALNLSLDQLRVAFSGIEGTGSVVRDGMSTVAATAAGLSHSHNWTESAKISGFPGVGVDIDWAATFVAAPGQSFVPGEPLPDGAYSPNGSVKYQVGSRASTFNVTTVEALQYDAACAADVATGLALSPFTGGTVQVDVSGEEGNGYVEVTYANCDWATVQFVAQ